MSEQIVDLIESVMPGPMGDVTHAAIEAVGEARRYAALAQANGWAMGGDASLAMRRLDLLDTLAGVNGRGTSTGRPPNHRESSDSSTAPR